MLAVCTEHYYFAGLGPKLTPFPTVMTVTIAVGLQDRPSTAPSDTPWESDYKLFAQPTFTKAISAVSTIIFAYAGTPGFFPIVAEMRDPLKYTRSLVICQSTLTATYISVGCVVYFFCGSYVAAPALGSAGVLVKKISYGIALPGLVVSTIVVLHVSDALKNPLRNNFAYYTQFASKYVFVRLLRQSQHLTANTWVHWLTWLGCTFGVTVSAYLIASGIPVFSDLVALIGALLGTLMSFQPYAGMWFYDNWKSGRENPTHKWYLMVFWCIFVIVSGTFIMIAGTYGAVLAIIATNNASSGSFAWSCADNSASS